jgi:predicted dehydrogenase
VELSVVYGPNAVKARAFAERHGIHHATSDLETAIGLMDFGIICSPTGHHYRQALELLHYRIPVLVELPACGTGAEARALADAARSTLLACAHTSRYLQPYQLLHRWICDGTLGVIRQVQYIRHIPPRPRSWTDDALIHHAAHVLDLLLHWFDQVNPALCLAQPRGAGAQDLILAARAGDMCHSAINISYTSHLPQLAMTVVGSRHTLITDGFSFIRSDAPELEMQFDGGGEYHRAIFQQDHAFLAGSPTPWTETVRLQELTDAFRTLGGSE